jgi:hypothetical protein
MCRRLTAGGNPAAEGQAGATAPAAEGAAEGAGADDLLVAELVPVVAAALAWANNPATPTVPAAQWKPPVDKQSRTQQNV